MKFSARTLQVLRNFSTIHQAMIFKPGTELKVMSDSKSILAKAVIDTDIERQFAVYDLTKFLGAISMFEDPNLIPHDSFVEIAQGTEKINYTYSEPSLIKAPPEKDINFPVPDVVFDLKNDALNRALKGMAITGANAVCIVGDGENIFLETKTILTTPGKSPIDKSGAPSYRAEVGTTDKTFCFVFMAENIKLIPGDYTVSISQRGLSHFKGSDVEYWVAVEANSTFGE